MKKKTGGHSSGLEWRLIPTAYRLQITIVVQAFRLFIWKRRSIPLRSSRRRLSPSPVMRPSASAPPSINSVIRCRDRQTDYSCFYYTRRRRVPWTNAQLFAKICLLKPWLRQKEGRLCLFAQKSGPITVSNCLPSVPIVRTRATGIIMRRYRSQQSLRVRGRQET